MSIPNTIKLKIPATHLGGMLREDFLPDCDLTVTGLAAALDVSRQTFNELMGERSTTWCPRSRLRLELSGGVQARSRDGASRVPGPK